MFLAFLSRALRHPAFLPYPEFFFDFIFDLSGGRANY